MSTIFSVGRFHCLIIDDSNTERMIGKKRLDTLGVECECAKDGIEGISKCQAKYYDCVVLDYNMPLKNGMETAQEILNINRNYHILGCTTETEGNPGIVKEWMAVGVKEVLPKNWGLVEQKVRELLQKLEWSLVSA